MSLPGTTPAPIPDWLHVAGGIGATPSGQTVRATLNLAPGKYAVTDRGALAEFEVTEGEDGPLPASTATFVATTGPKDSLKASALRVGNNRLRLVNRGKEMHQPFMVPILPGKTFADVKRFFMAQDFESQTAPVDFERAVTTAMVEGDTEQVVDFEPLGPAGKYVIVCFLADRDGQGGSHFRHGSARGGRRQVGVLELVTYTRRGAIALLGTAVADRRLRCLDVVWRCPDLLRQGRRNAERRARRSDDDLRQRSRAGARRVRRSRRAPLRWHAAHRVPHRLARRLAAL